MFYAHDYEKGAEKTRLAQWQEIQKRTGKPIKWLDERPICPHQLQYVWEIYLEIKKGAKEIDYNTLNSYVNVTGVKLTQVEVKLLMDTEYIRRHPDDRHS